MSKSLAERALCEVQRRLKGIRPEDGYATSAGLKIFRARQTLAVADLPAAVIWDAGETVPDPGMSRDVISMQVNVEIHVQADLDDTGENLEAAKADVKRAIRALKSDVLSDKQGTIGVLKYDGAIAFARKDGAVSESITIKFLALITEVIGDPYSSK